MKTEKMTKKDERKASLLDLELDGRKYLRRVASLHGVAGLIQALRIRKPKDLGDQVDSAFEGLDALEAALQQASDQLGQEREAMVASTRVEMLSAVAKVTGPLVGFMASADDTLATEATAVMRASFGKKARQLARMSPSDAWIEIRGTVRKLESQPALRKRVEALVPRAAVAQMITSHAALGDAAQLTKVDDAPTVDVRKVIGRANALIDRYAMCVLSTAHPDDAESCRVAEAALRPIVELRAEGSRRRRKAKGAAVVEEVESDEEVDADDVPAETPVVTPTPTPPVVARREGDDG